MIPHLRVRYCLGTARAVQGPHMYERISPEHEEPPSLAAYVSLRAYMCLC